MRRILPIILIAVMVLAAGIYIGYIRNVRRAESSGPALTFTVLDADYGNAIVVTTPEGKYAVIDPGPIASQERLIEYLKDVGVRHTVIVLTSTSATHCGSVNSLLQSIPVERILRGEPDGDSSAWKNAMDTATEMKIPQIRLSAGDAISLSRSTKIEVLSPPASLYKGTEHDSDNNSLVIRLSIGKQRILITSDIRVETEAQLINSGIDLRNNILIVPRHGRYGSTSLELLSVVRPESCIVAVSPYGQPSRAILERLDPENTGASLYRTDNDGNIDVVCNGRSISVNTEGGRQE